MLLKEYIDAGLVHSIHTSERRSFRSCRRRWDWTSRQMYYPRVTPEPLEFGVAFHKAMEVFYEPSTWDRDLVVRQALALVAFKKVCDEQLKEFTRLNGEPEIDKIENYRERIKLGLNMIRNYTENISPVTDIGFRPIEVEVAFEVPILSPEGEPLWCKCDRCWQKTKNDDRDTWQGLPVTYGGRLDMLAEHIETGRLYIYDWKQLTTDSPVLTPSGWSKMGNLKVGDFVIGSNGKPTKVTGVYPKGLHQVYEVEFRDGTVIECSKDHAWYVKDCNGKFSVKETQQLIDKPSYQRYAVPLISGPVEFNSQKNKLPMHPYVLGSLLGDGSFVGSVLKYSSKSGETIELLKKYATSDVVFKDQRHMGSNSWQIDGPWRSQLRELNLWNTHSHHKLIPQIYLEASVEDRILLLQGLADTDGNTGILRITTTSAMLAECIRELIWSLGGKAFQTVSKERLHQNGKTINVPQYGINYWLPDSIEPNQLERKRIGRKAQSKGLHRSIKEVRATDNYKEMLCIRVEAKDHLYVTDNYILTHNTTSRILDEDAEASFLSLDDQIASYVWALRYLGMPVVGFVYVEIKKSYPSAPEELTRLYKGRRFSCNKQHLTTADIFRKHVAEHDPISYADGLYDKHIEWLKVEGTKFHQRHQVHKNDHEVDEVGYNIWLEAQDITGNPRVYPQPGRFSCTTCLFRQPCIGKNQGEDYVYTLDSLFEKRTKHYYEDKEPSTE